VTSVNDAPTGASGSIAAIEAARWNFVIRVRSVVRDTIVVI
jgi:hypothetical protein